MNIMTDSHGSNDIRRNSSSSFYNSVPFYTSVSGGNSSKSDGSHGNVGAVRPDVAMEGIEGSCHDARQTSFTAVKGNKIQLEDHEFD